MRARAKLTWMHNRIEEIERARKHKEYDINSKNERIEEIEQARKNMEYVENGKIERIEEIEQVRKNMEYDENGKIEKIDVSSESYINNDKIEQDNKYFIDYNIKYVYHGTCYPIFLYNGGVPRKWSFYSVVESHIFSKRCIKKIIDNYVEIFTKKKYDYNSKTKYTVYGLLPMVIKYRILNPLRRVLLLDEELHYCNINICSSGKRKNKQCNYDSECTSKFQISSLQYFSNVLNYYNIPDYYQDQDSLVKYMNLLNSPHIDGWLWSNVENQIVIADSNNLIIDSVKFLIDPISDIWTDWIYDPITIVDTFHLYKY